MIVRVVLNSHLDPIWLWNLEQGIDAALAAALSLLALCALYAPLVRSHGPAASGDQLAQAALRTPSLPYPFDCVM